VAPFRLVDNVAIDHQRRRAGGEPDQIVVRVDDHDRLGDLRQAHVRLVPECRPVPIPGTIAAKQPIGKHVRHRREIQPPAEVVVHIAAPSLHQMLAIKAGRDRSIQRLQFGAFVVIQQRRRNQHDAADLIGAEPGQIARDERSGMIAHQIDRAGDVRASITAAMVRA